MGKLKCQSKKSRRKGVNPRAPKTALSQYSGNLPASWTPVFARGKIKIYLCGLGDGGPEKFTDSNAFAQFIRGVLPRLLREMQQKHGWSTTPRVVIHGKAS